MDTPRLIAAIVATVAAVPAAVLIVRTELRVAERRTARRVMEVALPLVGLVVLLAIVWAD